MKQLLIALALALALLTGPEVTQSQTVALLKDKSYGNDSISLCSVPKDFGVWDRVALYAVANDSVTQVIAIDYKPGGSSTWLAKDSTTFTDVTSGDSSGETIEWILRDNVTEILSCSYCDVRIRVRSAAAGNSLTGTATESIGLRYTGSVAGTQSILFSEQLYRDSGVYLKTLPRDYGVWNRITLYAIVTDSVNAYMVLDYRVRGTPTWVRADSVLLFDTTHGATSGKYVEWTVRDNKTEKLSCSYCDVRVRLRHEATKNSKTNTGTETVRIKYSR